MFRILFFFFFFFFENRAVYGIMWENTVEPERPQVTIWRMRIACWILKATDTHSEYYFSTATVVCTNAPYCYVIRT